MKIYVSNLSFDVQNEDLSTLFAEYGIISSVNVIMDKFTNRSRGFAFVEMPDDNDANKAIRGLDGKSISGRNIRVSEARPREEKSSGSSYSNRR